MLTVTSPQVSRRQSILLFAAPDRFASDGRLRI